MKLAVALGLILVIVASSITTGQQLATPVYLANDQFRPVPIPAFSPQPTPGPILDTMGGPQPTRPAAPAPTPHLIVVAAARPPTASSGHSLTGPASWYCSTGIPICFHGYGPGTNTAAAGPALRAAICGLQSCTSWRNRVVLVNGVQVTLRDWCQCYWHEPKEKIIDLYKIVFDKTGGDVTITW